MEILVQKLNEFGLNPADWQLSPTAESEYKVISKEDPEIWMLGKADQDSGHWISLQLNFD
ncbi:MAG: hypothetical protein LW875_02765 [Proteobacteria bacterium]|jgi:hypothetical protein|nr:hypothetical protein [Pseudomonadota bacterium]